MRIHQTFRWVGVLLLLFIHAPQTRTRNYLGQLSPAAAQALLRSWVGAECPPANAVSTDDWTRVRLLRQWAWRHTPWCSAGALLNPQPDQAPGPPGAEEIFADFAANRGGVWCGGAAYALRRLYEAYGYRCWTYDSGLPGLMTHVVTIVQIRHGGRHLLVVEDPTFNLEYTDASGQPLDVRDLLRRLATGQGRSITVQYGDMHQQRAFLLGSRDSVTAYQDYIDPTVRGTLLSNGLRRYRSCLTTDTFWHAAGRPIANGLARRGLPGKFMYLLACPLRTIPDDLLPSLYPDSTDPQRGPSMLVHAFSHAD